MKQIILVGILTLVGVFNKASSQDTVDPSLQRSYEIYTYEQSASSGPERGNHLYYYKCWVCHNQFVREENGQPALTLKNLSGRPRLLSGQPVTADTVAEKIRNGGPVMPAFRHTLSDADIKDLVDYLLDDDCCFSEYEPPKNPRYLAGTSRPVEFEVRNNLRGGPTGSVRSSEQAPLEGIMVQLISQANAMRTTVYSNADGRYEFPKLPVGSYTLRIARPLEFQPYQRNAVQINGATALREIVLEPVTNQPSPSEFLPPTREIMAQLTDAEWLMNLSGTLHEKRTFLFSCNWCHSYQQIFRNRYEEKDWRLIVKRMTTYTQSILHSPRDEGRETPEARETIVKWLASVRGPGAKDPPIKTLPGPRGAATRVIITEYELPRLMIAPHDIDADAEGNIWYTPHRSPYLGRLDPATGIVKEYRVPDSDPKHPGTHGIWVDKNGIVWAGENWRQQTVRLDPRTGEFTVFPDIYICSVHPDGSFLGIEGPEGDKAIEKFNTAGEVLKRWPLKVATGSYNCTLSKDGRYWGGGTWRDPPNVVVRLDTQTGDLLELETRSPMSHPARAGFDPEGNLWLGGRLSNLIKLDGKKRQVFEYTLPTPFNSFYEVTADKNGDAWGGEVHGGRVMRFNPRTEQMIEYVLPEPYAHSRRAWIDNSTDPVAYWYVDHNGYMVRVQPLE